VSDEPRKGQNRKPTPQGLGSNGVTRFDGRNQPQKYDSSSANAAVGIAPWELADENPKRALGYPEIDIPLYVASSPSGASNPFPSTSHVDSRGVGWYGTLAILAACLTLLATLFFTGCSGPGQAHAVDPPRAREAHKSAQDGCKKGESIPARELAVMPVTIQDDALRC
jgi:hypothetical protein